MAPIQIDRIAFLTPGNFAPERPAEGLEQALDLIAHGEALGYDGAWVRQRHLEPGIGAAAPFLAAASQRTRRIELGSAVIQLGYENPFRLAEDLSLVDVLAHGRLNVGVSVGSPPFGALLGPRLFDGDPSTIDFSHARALRLADNLRGEPIGGEDAFASNAAGQYRARLQPFAPGLVDRLWYGGGSNRSVEWAGRNGFNLLIGNLNSGENGDDFHQVQRAHLDLYRRHWQQPRPPRIALGRVIVPLDGADAATRAHYLQFAAGRHARTLAPQGERRTLFAPDLVGSSEQIVERLLADPVLPEVRELRLELPYEFTYPQYRQIISDFVRRIAPALGWKPGAAPAA
ncbi:LLM class flavin-dependent oxidoreductase [Stenotrophomonas sp. MMGLT7]|uniref:LLM class flavin-dependent oxidoreductase n=1 Tax=Stenotrophomonas sp. MMGLT7 TaxID=2901227 RepID=UPI001E654073|nr:LLM class flavin-dependent oxidoreductase [Stenotrophomonas sp. MMGLT7]MCD7097247.1 LLM class flavin-dependent oxidoreductase [Stenotrophomonas sp. MMGLT7]